jgi:hypothetical protein
LFVPGRQDNVFSVVFGAEEELTWTLNTPYVDSPVQITFNAQTTACQLDIPTPTNLIAQIQPIAECVSLNEDGTVTARFGYDNLFVTSKARAKQLANSVPLIAVKSINDNYIEPANLAQSQTTYFRPGRQTNTFFVVASQDDLPVSWSVRGLDGQIRTAQADLDTTQCISNNKFDKDIVPVLNCITHNEDGTYTARFGYDNLNTNGIATINIGASNTFTTSSGKDVNGRQVNKFAPGEHDLTFFVVFQEEDLPATWSLTAPNGLHTTLTVTTNGPQICPVLV